MKAAFAELEAANWIRRLATGQKAQRGRPASPKYEINPAICATKRSTPSPTKLTKRKP